MILSRTAVYAVKAILHLAEQGEGTPRRTEDIADTTNIPRNYLSKILHTLARNDLLESSRGPRGGFLLAKSPADISLLEVVRLFDDGLASKRCLLGRAECLDEDPCPAHARWEDVAAAVHTFFCNTTVADLIRNPNPPGGSHG